MDQFITDIDSTGFLDFTFILEGYWDDPSMGIVEPTVGLLDDADDGPEGFPFGPASTTM